MTQTQKQNVPKLRFPGFKGTWSNERCDRFLKRTSIPVIVETEKLYSQIGIRSHGKGIFHKDPVTGLSLGNKRVFEVVPNTLALNIVFAWEQAIAILTDKDSGFVASHRFPMYSEKKGSAYIDFFKYFFLRPRGKWLLELASPGGAGRNKTLGQSNFAELKIYAPTLPEQRKIAGFLTAVDKKIAQLSRKKALLEDYKKGCMQQLFSKKIRFKDEGGNDFPDWEEKRLGELVSIKKGQQLNRDDMIDGAAFPVINGGITASGYTDTFNTKGNVITISEGGNSCGYVDWQENNFWLGGHCYALPVKGKTALDAFLLQFLRAVQARIMALRVGSGLPNIQKRDLEKLDVSLPHPAEQRKIADFLSALDRKIDLVAQELTHARSFKAGLLQQMFV